MKETGLKQEFSVDGFVTRELGQCLGTLLGVLTVGTTDMQWAGLECH